MRLKMIAAQALDRFTDLRVQFDASGGFSLAIK
jgi:hypothetical protein